MPRVTITKSELKAMNPCNLESRLALFGDRESLTIRQAFKAGATVSDILWIAGRKGFTAAIAQFATSCAADAAAAARYAAAAAAARYAAADAAARYAADAARYAAAADAARYAADARYAARYAAAAAADAADAARYAAAAAVEEKRQRAHLIQLFG